MLELNQLHEAVEGPILKSPIISPLAERADRVTVLVLHGQRVSGCRAFSIFFDGFDTWEGKDAAMLHVFRELDGDHAGCGQVLEITTACIAKRLLNLRDEPLRIGMCFIGHGDVTVMSR